MITLPAQSALDPDLSGVSRRVFPSVVRSDGIVELPIENLI